MASQIAPGTQRVIAIDADDGDGEDRIPVLEQLQGWIDDGWRCVALTYVDDGRGVTIAVIEAGADCKEDQADAGNGLLEDDGSPAPGTPGSEWQRLASHEVIAGGGFWWRRSPPVDPDPQNSDPDPDVIDLCAGRGGKGGTIRLRVGQTVTAAWLLDLQSLLCAATVEGN